MQRRFYTLWAINDALDERRLCAQLDQMRALGFDGAVFHPRFYPNHPPYLGEDYLAVLSRVVVYAKSIGMDIWIYDEDGWPSGTVGGQLLKQHPEDAQQWADLVTKPPDDCLATFIHGGQTWYVARRVGAGVDYLNPELARHFLQMTHERYRTGLSPEAWEHVSTFFTDEPELGLGHAYDALSPHGAIPWTPRLPQLFEQRYGQPLALALPLIFLGSEGADIARIRFWELLADLFIEAFIRPIDDWCRHHGKRFTGHVKGEEHPLFQVPMVGSCTTFYRAIGMPGIDALERFPSNDFYPRQAASASEQFGDGQCMAECFGGAGWGAGPRDLECYLLWLGRLGVTDFVLHLWQYRLDSHAIRDWPASIPNHVSWANVFPQVLANVKADLDQPEADIDTLVITPHRGIMAAFAPCELDEMNIHNAGTYAMSAAGKINADFMATVSHFQPPPHYTDEHTAESGTSRGGRFALGHRSYSKIYVAPGCRLSRTVEQNLGSLRIELPQQHLPADSDKPLCQYDSVRLSWHIAATQLNDFPLDPEPVDGHIWRARFVCAETISAEIIFADDVANVTLNGQPIAAIPNGNGATAKSTEPLAAGAHELRFSTLSKPATPSLWLHGLFRALPQQPFAEGPNGTVMTVGGFRLHPAIDGPVESFAAAGYGFCRSAVILTAAFSNSGSANTLRIGESGADAVDVEIDGTPVGTVYKEEQTLALPDGRCHEITLRLYSSAFNAYGPHHYFAGDRFVISPDQFAGRRNFADPAGAPACTTVATTFVRDVSPPCLYVGSR
ncbi:MAG: hypothetical protein JWM57_2657 [Phycisphaerales bacterium]|nr:hypothetical protein [Phycisphaerales bacterium]